MEYCGLRYLRGTEQAYPSKFIPFPEPSLGIRICTHQTGVMEPMFWTNICLGKVEGQVRSAGNFDEICFVVFVRTRSRQLALHDCGFRRLQGVHRKCGSSRISGCGSISESPRGSFKLKHLEQSLSWPIKTPLPLLETDYPSQLGPIVDLSATLLLL